MATEVLKLGSDKRIYWTIPMDIIFERTFKTARALTPPPTLNKIVAMIHAELVRVHPKLRPYVNTRTVLGRYNYFRRHFPKQYAFRILNEQTSDDKKEAAVEDVIDSEKRRKLDAIETLFPTYDVNQHLRKILTLLEGFNERLNILGGQVAKLEDDRPTSRAISETIRAQMSLLLIELGVPEHKVLSMLSQVAAQQEAAKTGQPQTLRLAVKA